MKQLYLVGGTMGVGKTTTCQALKRLLDRSVFLDGDWCWDSSPFQVTKETKAMAMDNICYLLNNFLRCRAYESVIFCWVMHEKTIIDEILRRVDTKNCAVKVISLVCTPSALEKRLQRDVEASLRSADVIGRSLERLSLYEALNTIKIDVSELTAEEAARKIAAL